MQPIFHHRGTDHQRWAQWQQTNSARATWYAKVADEGTADGTLTVALLHRKANMGRKRRAALVETRRGQWVGRLSWTRRTVS